MFPQLYRRTLPLLLANPLLIAAISLDANDQCESNLRLHVLNYQADLCKHQSRALRKL